MALEALSLYATQVFNLEGSSTVTVQSSLTGGDVYTFDVTRDNRLLYQEKPLNVPSRYSVKVKGSTCVSVQVCICTFISASVVLVPILLCLDFVLPGCVFL